MAGLGVILVALCAITSFSSAEQCSEFAIFDFGTVRGGAPWTTRPHLGPPYPDLPCGSRPTQVLCSHAAYPDDILCDFGGLGSHHRWRKLSSVFGIEVRYEASNSNCSLQLKRRDGGARFVFVMAVCSPEVADETVPPFRLADALRLVLKLDTVGGTGGCLKEEYYLARAPPSGARGGHSGVRFDVLDYSCETTLQFGYLVFGKSETFTKFENDGRRYRPSMSSRRTTKT